MDINGIARLAGVSRATVSRYLNDGCVSEEKRRLITGHRRDGLRALAAGKTLRTGRPTWWAWSSPRSTRSPSPAWSPASRRCSTRASTECCWPTPTTTPAWRWSTSSCSPSATVWTASCSSPRSSPPPTARCWARRACPWWCWARNLRLHERVQRRLPRHHSTSPTSFWSTAPTLRSSVCWRTTSRLARCATVASWTPAATTA